MKPIALIKAEGNLNKSRFTKAELKRREENEIHAQNDKIFTPDYLTEQQQEKFNFYCDELMRINLMSNLDCECLAKYIYAQDMYETYSKQLVSIDALEETELAEKLIKFQDKYFQQAMASAKELGLTISSRCKLVAPFKEKPKENKFQKFEKKEATECG